MQCTAQRKKGKGPCKRRAIEGGTVCLMHGGGAPQVKKSARERLALMVDPALMVLMRSMKLKPKESPNAIALQAARDVLDRTIGKATDKIQLSGMGPAGEIVTVSAADMLKSELDALHKRLADGANSSAPGPRTNGAPQPPTT